MAAQQEDNYRLALTNLNQLYAVYSKIPGYVREKKGEELSIQQAKKVFGRFTPDNKALMQANDNQGMGVNITLDDGNILNIPNQLELFNKVVQFNKENGKFCDEKFIQRHSPDDYAQLMKYMEAVEETKNALISSYPANMKQEAYAKAREIETLAKEALRVQQDNHYDLDTQHQPQPAGGISLPSLDIIGNLNKLFNSVKPAITNTPAQRSFADYMSETTQVSQLQLLDLAKHNSHLLKSLNAKLNEPKSMINEPDIINASAKTRDGLVDFYTQYSRNRSNLTSNDLELELKKQKGLMKEVSKLAQENPSDTIKANIKELAKLLNELLNKFIKKEVTPKITTPN